MYSSLNHGLRLVIVATLVAITCASSNAQIPEDLRPQVEALMDEYLSRPGRVGVAIGILRNDKTSFANYGSIAKDRTIPTQQTIFEIRSISKTITGTLLAQSVVDGKLTLDDDVKVFTRKAHRSCV